MAEALLDHADLQALAPLPSALRVGLGRHAVLARVEAVGPRQHLEQERVVGDRGRHRAGVVERQLDRHDAGVGHQAVGRLQAVDAAVGRRACGSSRPGRRPAPSADLARGDHRGAARRRAAGRVAHLVRVVHRPGRAGVAAAGEAEILADGLADDGAAGVEDAGDDGGVDVGHVALERRGAVHHRHAGEADVVLERHLLALELAGGPTIPGGAAPRTGGGERIQVGGGGAKDPDGEM